MKSFLIISSHPLGENSMASIRLERMLPYLLRDGAQGFLLSPSSKKPTTFSAPNFHRIEIPLIRSSPSIGHRTIRKLAFPVVGALVGASLVRRHKIQNVVASVPEVEALMAGAFIKRMLGPRIRFTLEIRDPFSINETYPWSAGKRNWYQRLERKLLRTPDQVIFLTEGIQKMYLTSFANGQPWVNRHKVISNGFEPRDFKTPEARNSGSTLKMSYIGSFYDGRTPIAFLEALNRYITRVEREKVPEIHIIGTVHGEELKSSIEQLANAPALRGKVFLNQGLSADAACLAAQNSDVNLLITHDKGSEYAIPGKLFDYMGSGRPVLAFTRDPYVKQMIERTQSGWVCETEAELQSWFENYLANPEKVRSYRPMTDALKPYEISEICKAWQSFVNGDL